MSYANSVVKQKYVLYFFSIAIMLLAYLFLSTHAYANSATLTPTQAETNVKDYLGIALNILTYVSYTAGVFFIFASLFKFDQHKKNPTQIPMSQPLTLFVIGAALCLLPTVINFATGGGSKDSISIGGTTAS
jgi:intracellular multiplication protein IcmD